jgi:hypothetical protein
MSPADIEQKLRSDIGNAGQRRTDRDGGYPNSRSPRVFQKFGSIPLLTFATVSPQKPTFRIQHYATALRRYCCKSLLGVLNENSRDRRCGFRAAT